MKGKLLLRSVAITCFIILSANVFASDIAKAFKSLNAGDYPNAVKFLREVLVDEPENAAANYGMAKYYFSKDNTAYNLDSANVYIIRASKKLPMNPDDKATKKYMALGVRDYTITSLQKDINNEAYNIAEKANTVESYQYFIDNYTEPGLVYRATGMRNQLAFIRARAKNDPAMLEDFLKKYPTADQAKEARDLYEKLVYEQTTAPKTYESYKAYLDKYPNGLYVDEAREKYNFALLDYYNNRHTLQDYLEFEKLYPNHPNFRSVEDSIYTLATSAGTVEAYKNFIKTYMFNPNVRNAWEQLYTLYTAQATDSVYVKFTYEFPDFPDRERVLADMSLAVKDLKPFEHDDKWGYAYTPTKDSLVMVIPGEYEEAVAFSNGLAAVRIKPCNPQCSYFYINKADKQVFNREFSYAGDFYNGLAIVGTGNCDVDDSCLYGIIDKRGEFRVPPVYQDIEDETEGYFMVTKNDRSGFINHLGKVVISLRYTNALPFKEGVAAVQIDSNWFFIDTSGAQAFISRFNDVSSFSDSLCAVTSDGVNWGYIDHSGNYVIQPQYESAEDFENGFGIISKREKDPRNRAMFISQRYKIDKLGKILEKLTAPKPVKPAYGRKKGHK